MTKEAADNSRQFLLQEGCERLRMISDQRRNKASDPQTLINGRSAPSKKNRLEDNLLTKAAGPRTEKLDS